MDCTEFNEEDKVCFSYLKVEANQLARFNWESVDDNQGIEMCYLVKPKDMSLKGC